MPGAGTGSAATVGHGAPRAGHQLHEGDRLGRRYLLQRRIGSGGMSVVWRAWDEALQRPVAVKVTETPLSASFGDRELIRREARAAARIDHPHAMGVYDIGETITSGGRLTAYVVMRLLDGRSLADQLDEGPLPWPEAVAVAGRVAEVLTVAHAHGIVHRDVTPENVMLTDEGAKLLDFGIAAQVGERDDEMHSPLFGTPPYVAPERLRGAQAEGATDVYALGVLLFQMLTGHTPYPETTWDELESARRSGRPPRPRGVPGLPRRVSRICRRCISDDPAARPTAREVATELTAARLHTDDRRSRRLVVAAATVTTVGIVAIATVVVPLLLTQNRHGPHDRAAGTPTPSVIVSPTPVATESPTAPASPPPSRTSAAPPSSARPSSTSPAPTGTTVAQARDNLYAILDAGVAARTVTPDVALDLRNQVAGLVNNVPPTATERHRRISAIQTAVQTRTNDKVITDPNVTAALNNGLAELGAALDRAAASPG